MYFSVSAAVQAFNQCQIEGLKAIPGNRLLLESDSLYFPPGKAKICTPAYIGETAAFVAVHRDIRPPELLQLVTRNARDLYNL